MKNKIYKAFSITLPLCLTGCMGIYEGGFECPAGTGVGCKSISEVNNMVNLGDLPKSQVKMPLESNGNAHTCNTCGRSSGFGQDQPEIWINPLYFRTPGEAHQEEPQDEPLFLHPEKGLPHGTISL